MDAYQQQQQSVDYGQNEFEKRRDSRPQSRTSSKAGSRSNSRPSSRPMSRASSQQRFYDDTSEYGQQQQQRSISRNDSQKSLTDYQRQPDPLITTRIEESYVEPGMEIRKPSVTFKGDEYEQQQNNLQQMAEQGSALYSSPTQPQYDEQSYYQQPQSEYDYSQQQNMGYGYDQQQYIPQQQYEQQQPDAKFYQPESRRQSPENSYQQMQGYTESRRQSPAEQQYPYESQTPKRQTPPKTPTREQSREELDKVVQQRQQSSDQLYDGELSSQQQKALSSKQQSRDNLSESQGKSPSPPSSQNTSPTSTTAPTTNLTRGSTNASSKQVAPPSPKRSTAARNSKGGAEQKAGRNSMGEAASVGRKSDNLQKQSAKVSNIRGKK